MKNLLFLLTVLFGACLFANCKKDNSIHKAHIIQPTSANKTLGDVLYIEVDFETFNGQPVEHINIKIVNAARTVTVYNGPWDPHPRVGGTTYTFEDQFTLSHANGITPGDWILEARVYRDEDGKDEVVESVEFHINL